MAYSDSVGDNSRLLKRTLAGVTDFSGRSRRTEVVYYQIATALVSAVLNFSVYTFVSFEAWMLFAVALRLVLMVPLFALFVRRIHDQNRSGWWGVVLPLFVMLSLPRIANALHGDIHSVVAPRTPTLAIIEGLCALGILFLCFLPGTQGDNQFGPDPRLEEV